MTELYNKQFSRATSPLATPPTVAALHTEEEDDVSGALIVRFQDIVDDLGMRFYRRRVATRKAEEQEEREDEDEDDEDDGDQGGTRVRNLESRVLFFVYIPANLECRGG